MSYRECCSYCTQQLLDLGLVVVVNLSQRLLKLYALVTIMYIIKQAGSRVPNNKQPSTSASRCMEGFFLTTSIGQWLSKACLGVSHYSFRVKCKQWPTLKPTSAKLAFQVSTWLSHSFGLCSLWFLFVMYSYFASTFHSSKGYIHASTNSVVQDLSCDLICVFPSL